MKFIISNKLRIKKPDERLKKYCSNNLILPNQEYLNKKRMGLWTGKTPEAISYYEKDGEDYILPYGCINDLAFMINSSDYELDLADAPRIFERNTDIELYDYQKKAVKRIEKFKNGILVSPTGSGKTVMGIYAVGEIAQKTLWLCHTKELLQQAKKTYENIYNVSKNDIGVVSEGKVEIGDKITFAVVNTLSSVSEIDKFIFGAIFVDETHFAIKSMKNSAMFSKCIERFAARYKIGLTATFHRADKQEKLVNFLLGNVFHEISREVVSEKIMRVQVIKTPIDTKNDSWQYLDTDGTVNFNKLVKYISENKTRNRKIAEYINELINEHSILVLCDRLAQIEQIFNCIENKDLAVAITGSMTSKAGKEARKKAIEDMREGKKHCLIATTKLAGTGLDIPCLDTLMWVNVQKDYGIVTQGIGRISRIHDGKDIPVCYDFHDANISYCVNAHKARLRHYKNCGCEIKEGAVCVGV